MKTKVIIVKTMNETPEEEVNDRIQELGDEWRVSIATTHSFYVGEMDVHNSGLFIGIARHVYYVTTIVFEKS